MKSTQEKKLLKVGYQDCSNCKTRLIKTHSRRNLQDLTKSYYIDTEIGRCGNESCSFHGIRIYPAEYRALIYPKSDYSLGVYAEIGYQRLVESKSVSQIRKSLEQKYPSLGLKERSIENIYKRVQVCLRERQEDKEVLNNQLSKSGISQLCLTLDGIAPERGNAILYVVREVQSSHIIYARYLEHSDTAHLQKELFEPLKELLSELCCDLGGWLCDKQSGFISAIELVYPDVPIHLCQSHFLKAMGKPVQQADSEMANGIKKKLRPLKQIEKDLETEVIAENNNLSAKEQSCLKSLCLLPRTWISRSISVSYELRGVAMYKQFKQAISSIEKMEQKKNPSYINSAKKNVYQ